MELNSPALDTGFPTGMTSLVGYALRTLSIATNLNYGMQSVPHRTVTDIAV